MYTVLDIYIGKNIYLIILFNLKMFAYKTVYNQRIYYILLLYKHFPHN